MRFLAGTPRSGSTLLAALLNEHTDLQVTPTGWLAPLIEGIANAYQATDARKAWRDQEDARQRVNAAMRGAIEGYLGPRGVEKSRAAPALVDKVEAAMGQRPAVVILVRDLRDVAASMEKQVAADPMNAPSSTQAVRLNSMFQPNNPPLGSTLAQMKDAGERGLLTHAHVVKYEDLTFDPQAVIHSVAEYLGGTVSGDCTATSGDDREHDAIHGVYGEHSVKPGPVRPSKPQWPGIVTAEHAGQIVEANRWFYETFYPEALSD